MPDPHPIQSPHDKFFKQTFSHPDVAQDVFQAVLPPRLTQEADWATLALRAGTFVDEHLTATASDLLYQVRWRGCTVGLYLLFEHKSTPEELRLDLLQYMVRVWKQERKEAAADRPPPPVLPVVLYHGRQPWPYSTRFLDWLKLPEGLRTELAPFQPDFRHALMDLSQVPMSAVGGRLKARLALTLMKAVQEGRVLEWLDGFGALLLELASQEGMAGQFRAMLRYLFQAEASAPSTFRELAANVRDARIRESVMTIEEQIKLEGWQRGRQEGRHEGRQEGRQEGRHEGRREGAIIGQIQTCQELLNLPVSGLEELGQKTPEELTALLGELKGRLRSGPRS